eukprot:g17873.t1
MSHYVCGRQFIFEEEPRWLLLGLLVVMVAGMLIGLLLGLVIGLAGMFFFEMALMGLALFILYDAYDLTFLKKSGARDKTGFAFMVMFCTTLVLLFMAAMRYCAFNLSTQSRCVVFSIVGIALALVAYVYARLCCQEDERKHHLGPCSPEGELLEASDGERDLASRSWNLKHLQTFLSWIMCGQCFFEINDWLVPSEEDCSLKDQITVHNRSLKLIKVCLYSSFDVVCWVPIGGIAGSCVGFIRSGEKRTLTLPRPWRKVNGTESEESFRLKVFMPGLLDKELAFFPKAKRGQSFAFVDVEGVVRRSRLLSSQSCLPEATLPLPAMESSEEEYASAAAAALKKDEKFDSSGPGPGGLGLRKRSSLQVMKGGAGGADSPGIQLEGREERRFNPSTDEMQEFTLKVYSIGPASKELTYLTVRRGNAYTFCDSLLS